MTPRSFQSIDLLRGLAALAVCLSHFGQKKYVGYTFWTSLTQYGEYGVHAFFVISGFVIPLQLYQKQFQMRMCGQFLNNRFRRLYPACILSLILAALVWKVQYIILGGTPPDLDIWKIINNFLLTADVTDTLFYNGVVWTLAIEAQYYLLLAVSFPLLFSGIKWVRCLSLVAWLGLGLLPSTNVWVIYWTALFAVGIILFQQTVGIWSRWESVMLTFVALFIVGLKLGLIAVIVAVGTGVAIITVKELKHNAWKPFLFLGTISYSFYLLHNAIIGGKIMTIGSKVIGSDSPWMFLVMIVAIAASLWASWLYFKYVEKPSHLWSKRAWKK